jgi:simple sugar transport system permease protein
VNRLIPALLHSAVTIMTPLLFAAAGGLFSELAGMLNIALEGLLLTGAFFAVAGFYVTGSFAAAIAASVFAALLLAYIMAFFTLRLRSNVFITGLAANLLAAGAATIISYHLFHTKGVAALSAFSPLARPELPVIKGIPVLGALLSGHSAYVYASWALLFAAWLILYKMPFGYRLRSCGVHEEALASLGLKPDAYRMAAFLLSGFYCGIGGSFLSLNLGAFVPNISAGKGWIALVVIFLGGRRPAGLLAAAFVFGLAEAFSNYAQGRFNMPADLILAAPYVFTFLVMTGASALARRR